MIYKYLIKNDEFNENLSNYYKKISKIYKQKLSLQEYLNIKFNDIVSTYPKMKKLEHEYIRRYNDHIWSLKKIIEKNVEKEKHRLYSILLDEMLLKIPEKHLIQLSMIYDIKEEKEKICDFYYSNGHNNTSDIIFSILRFYEKLKKEPLKEFVENNFESKEEFLIYIMRQEISFLHKWSIFGDRILYICDLIDYHNKRIQSTANVLNIIFRNRFYDTKSIEYIKATKFESIIIDLLKNGKIPFDSNTTKTIQNILLYFTLSYEDKKSIIYKYANDCCDVIFGKKGLSNYNLPFQYILTQEDYDYMIDNIIFIGEDYLTISRNY